MSEFELKPWGIWSNHMRASAQNPRPWRAWLLFTLVALTVALLALHGQITQDSSYHLFADQRTFLHVPNLWNVVSNLPFLAAGLYGLTVLFRGQGGVTSSLRPAYTTFFVAACLVAVGSAYYHLSPNDATLVWDRLPMALGFMAFFAAILGENIYYLLGRRGLVPLLAIGVMSVLWWQYSGDLRVYVLVQFLPILLIPVILVLYPSRMPGTKWIWAVLAAYLFAKVFEMFDAQIFYALGMSGHSLKHIAAASGVYFVALLIKARGLVVISD